MQTINKLSTISVLIPTLNSEKVLEKCLTSIKGQNYPKEKIEIIIADGGSTDKTLEIAKKYGVKICINPLKTGEAGKAVALKIAKNELVAMIDSDNILPDGEWFRRMVKPFLDKDIVISEPIKFTYRKTDPLLTRYFALLGMNDPLCLFTGNYDRFSFLTGKWTGLNFSSEDKGNYLKIKLDQKLVPTIGANGTFIRRKILSDNFSGDYLFDIDLVIKLIRIKKQIYIAKVKTGIIHTFVENDPRKFFKKQLRRISDLSYHTERGSREINWEKAFFWRIIWFQLQCLLVFPIMFQMVKGFIKKPDHAWLFHPVACYSTWIIYLYGWILGKINSQEISRKNWRQ